MPSTYVGNPVAVQAPSSAPGAGVAPSVSIPSDATDDMNTANISQMVKVSADFIAWLTQRGGNSNVGDGSDGALTFDGTSTVLGLVPSAGVYTMTRHLYATTILVTGASTKLVTNGLFPFATVSITTAAGGSISFDGPAASGATAGGNGGAGASGSANGTASANQTNTLSASAGLGGTGGNSSGNTGGAGGTLTALATPTLVHNYQPTTLGYLFIAGAWVGINTGSGGGGGAGTGVGSVGGGGGGVAGLLIIATRALILASPGDIHCTGGAGAAGVHTGGSAGGGGGGGGGTLIAAYVTCNQTLSAATNCAGGAGGAGTAGGGVNGTNGANGNLVLIPLGL